ncbi:hypothetical protein OESDEN_15982, partial [Oesophagostomum dentatum]
MFEEQWEIPLCSIHSIYYAPVKSRFRKPAVPQEEISSYQRFEVVIKFRDSFMHTVTAEVSFNDAKSWAAELLRCGLSGSYHWRIASQAFHASERERYQQETQKFVHSYPMYYVVPGDIGLHELNRMAEHWQLSRFPVWVWSSLDGVSLLRSSNLASNTEVNWEAKSLNDKVLECVRRASKSGELPHRLVLNDEVTVVKIAAAYDRLRRLCSVDSHEQFAARDKDWLARVNHTGWLQLVSYCLSKASEAV